MQIIRTDKDDDFLVAAAAAFPFGSWNSDTIGPMNLSSPRKNDRHFADDIFRCISLNENVVFWLKISPKFVPQGPIPCRDYGLRL